MPAVRARWWSSAALLLAGGCAALSGKSCSGGQALPRPSLEIRFQCVYRNLLTPDKIAVWQKLPDDAAREAFAREHVYIPSAVGRLYGVTPEVVDAVIARRVLPGMHKKLVLIAWGSPANKHKDTQSGLEQWTWRSNVETGQPLLAVWFGPDGLAKKVLDVKGYKPGPPAKTSPAPTAKAAPQATAKATAKPAPTAAK